MDRLAFNTNFVPPLDYKFCNGGGENSSSSSSAEQEKQIPKVENTDEEGLFCPKHKGAYFS